MAKTISANQGSVYLSSQSDNPLYVLAGVTVAGGFFGVNTYKYGDNTKAWTVTNQGTITGTGDGVYLYNGGVVTNSGATARISGGSNGVYLNHSAGTVTNAGTIVGTSVAGVRLHAGGTVTNSGTAASISGGVFGIVIANGAGAVSNQGTITGKSVNGVYIGTGGIVTNSGTAASIIGGRYGVYAHGGAATVTSQGTISGTTAAVHFANFNGNVFHIYPGAVTDGKVLGGSGTDTLALGSSASIGTVAGIGSQYTGFEVLDVDTSARWLLTGANTLAASASINLAGSATLDMTGTLTAPANLTLGGTGTLTLGGTGIFEVGTAATASAGQFVVDPGHTVISSGTVSVRYILNEGTISGTAHDGVYLGAGGTVTNSGTAARIVSVLNGVLARHSAATIANQGTIFGTNVLGVYLGAGGTVTNSTGALISGGQYGVDAKNNQVSVTNQGTISGTAEYGVLLGNGGVVTNSSAGATIFGGLYGVFAKGSATTITNYGTISGASGAVRFANVSGNVFRQFPGAVTDGVVHGGTGVDTLALGSSAAIGTISGIGSHYTGFEALDADAGAHWLLTGANTLAATASINLAGSATLEVGGTLTAPSNLTLGGTGTLAVDGTGTFEVGSAGTASAGQFVVDAGQTLVTSGTVSVGYILNRGTISGTSRDGVFLGAGGTVTNSGTAAIITGGRYGVAGKGTAATVANQGTITGTGYYGVILGAGGIVTNSGTAALINGGHAGVFAPLGGATFTNEGTMSGALDSGVLLSVGGMVTNGGTAALITGGLYGVSGGSGQTTIINRGTISGTKDAVRFGNVDGNLFRAFPDAVTNGIVRGGSGVDTLALGSSASIGTVTGIGSHYTGFEVLDVDAGASWLMTGANTLATSASIDVVAGASLEVAGTLLAGATLTLGGTGRLSVDAGGAVEVGTSADARTGQVVVDADSTLFYTGYVSLGTVLNQGVILGSDRSGVYLATGGIVTNSGTGAIISGPRYGVFAGGSTPTTVINQGSVAGTASIGVYLRDGGIVTNSGTAAVISGEFGVFARGSAATVINQGTLLGTAGYSVYLGAGGTVTNSGRITGSTDAVRIRSSTTGRVVIEPGAVFTGTVDGGNTIGATAVSTLELASAASHGSVTGVGTGFVNFGSIAFDPGARWFVAGDTNGLAGTISGFAFGDTIELDGITAIGSSFASGVLTLTEASGSATLNLPGTFTTSEFVVTNGTAGADVTLACFAEGTRIRTEHGAVAVEALRVGDRVPVVMGGEAQPIIWLGHRRVDCRRHPVPTDVWPVRLSAGAFGPGRPFRDLLLSPDHSVLVNGVLIPIRYLVNGKTIRQEARDEVTYWHVELAEHNVLYAEGVPAESYLDTGNRSAFANGGGVTDLHADFARCVWETRGCAPLVLSGPKLAAAKRRLHARVSALGHRKTDDACVRVLVDGREVVATKKAGRLQVRLRKRTEHVRLISRVWIPAHMQPDAEDARALGIAVSRVWLDGETIGLDEECFTYGWHALEPEWRWTDGDACIATLGARELAFEVMMTGTYWQDEANDEARVA